MRREVFIFWQSSLRRLYRWFEAARPHDFILIFWLYFFFIGINLLCYWLAMFTAFPELIFGLSGAYYFKVQFPVAILGAMFDTFSFFVTLYLVRKAINTTSQKSFIGHLSVDFIMAILATFWVLFVFSFSSWLVRYFDPVAEIQNFADRQVVYGDRARMALEDPYKNLKNIYFGIIMGISAMIPTVVHLSMAFKAILKIRFSLNRK